MRPRGRRARRAGALPWWLSAWLALSAGVAGATELLSVTGTDPTQPGVRRGIALGTHTRMVFRRDTQRVAIGSERIISVQPISPREILVLGEALGQSSLTVWFAGGETEQFVFVVQPDLTVLQRALREVHPAIRVESVAERDAVVLTGAVPDVSYSVAAESVANAYVSAGRRRRTDRPVLPAARGDAQADAGALERPGATDDRGGRVINLIRVQRVPLLERRLQEAIADVGGDKVVVERIMADDVPGPEDTFLLTGSVPNQIALTRVLTVAGRLLGGGTQDLQEEIQVVADESGAVPRRQALLGGGAGGGQGGQGGGLPGFGGGGGNLQLRPQNLNNRVQDNVGRATVVELLGGRLLSFIEVDDLPQVRVVVRIYEINRQRLREWSPEIDLINGDVSQAALLPTFGGVRAQGEEATRIGGASGTDIQNALSLVTGGVVNQFQVAGSRFAADVLFSALTEAGVARSLATPELLVLSGEIATFQVGGEVPVQTSVTTGAADRVFNSVLFVPFGVTLGVRPLVGDDDFITLDLQPQVIEPDFPLTAALRDSTDTGQTTTAFASRSLTTSARLRDGQVLLIGGLLQRGSSQQAASVPGIGSAPGVGRLARDESRDEQDRELVIVVSPSIVREPLPGARLWAFPGVAELLQGVARGNSAGASGTSLNEG